MKTKITFGIIVAVIIMTVILLIPPTKNEEFFITAPSIYHLQGDHVVIEIFEDKNGLLNIKTKYTDHTTVSKNGWIDQTQDWFLYVDKINELWLSCNSELAFIYDFDKDRGIKSVTHFPFQGGLKVGVHKELASKIPDVVKNRLPASTINILSTNQ